MLGAPTIPRQHQEGDGLGIRRSRVARIRPGGLLRAGILRTSVSPSPRLETRNPHSRVSRSDARVLLAGGAGARVLERRCPAVLHASSRSAVRSRLRPRGDRTNPLSLSPSFLARRALGSPDRLRRVFNYVTSLSAGGAARLKQLVTAVSAAELAEQARRGGIDHIHVHSCADAAHVAAMAYLLGARRSACICTAIRRFTAPTTHRRCGTPCSSPPPRSRCSGR